MSRRSSLEQRCRVVGSIGFVFYDLAVAETDDASGEIGDVVFVCDQDDGDALAVELLQQGHDLDAGVGVEGAGRLVGQNQLRIIDQRAGDGYPLLLPPRELRRVMVHALRESYLRQALFGVPFPLAGRHAAIEQGQSDVVQGGSSRQQVEMLEDEAELAVAYSGQFIARELRDLLAASRTAAARAVLLQLVGDERSDIAIARAIGDLLLARADGSPQRFYSLSAQIQRDRKAYYEILERTQKGDMDVTDWLVWFLESLQRALDQAHQNLDAVLTKARFWQRWAATPLNERQVKVLNRLLDGFDGKLTSSKWAAISKCSADTALRDINELLARGVLRKTAGGGRSTGYELNEREA